MPEHRLDRHRICGLYETIAEWMREDESRVFIGHTLTFDNDALVAADSVALNAGDALAERGAFGTILFFEQGQRNGRLHAHGLTLTTDPDAVDEEWAAHIRDANAGLTERQVRAARTRHRGRDPKKVSRTLRYATKGRDKWKAGLPLRAVASGALKALWALLCHNPRASFEECMAALEADQNLPHCFVCGGPMLPSRKKTCSDNCRRRLREMTRDERPRRRRRRPRDGWPTTPHLHRVTDPRHDPQFEDFEERVAICVVHGDASAERAMEIAYEEFSPLLRKMKPLPPWRTGTSQSLTLEAILRNSRHELRAPKWMGAYVSAESDPTGEDETPPF